MKILKSIGLYFVYPFLTFVLGIFTHIGYLNYFYPHKYTPQKETYFLEDNTYEVANMVKPVTTFHTRYVIAEYNLKNNSLEYKEEKIPEKYVGMNKNSFEEAILEYQKNPTLEDVSKGFVNIQLESFSSEEVRVKKNYQPSEKSTGYYLMVLDGKIVVMENDKKTVYLTTDIYADALSDTLKQELIQGKFIYNMEELYGFLESYTS